MIKNTSQTLETDKKPGKYDGKEIYIIENGKIIEIMSKDIKENDYIMEKGQMIIIDRDKKILRPFVEDLLRQMNIETLQIKLLKMLTLFTIISFFMCMVFGMISYSASNKVSKLNDQFDKIGKIQYIQPPLPKSIIDTSLSGTGKNNNSLNDL